MNVVVNFWRQSRIQPSGLDHGSDVHAPAEPANILRAAARFTIALLAATGVVAMPSAPEGVTEVGAPGFVLFGPEALGLSSPATDLHIMPDGRILIVSQRELTFGDGVRWDTFRQSEDQLPIQSSVAVDHDGSIYTNITGGFARIEMDESAHWRIRSAVSFPEIPGSQNINLVSVTQVADAWYWYGGNGAIVSWRPGQAVRYLANLGAIERVFEFNGEIFLSDESSGKLSRMPRDFFSKPQHDTDPSVSTGVTCAVPFDENHLLVGTGGDGLKLFDGTSFRPLGPPGLLRDKHRITDLCATDNGNFAASIDTVGIVFFNRDGRVLQVLGRTLDHRLARVRKLKYAANGVLWALMNHGVARVEYPSVTSVSNFEPLLESGLTYAQPLRHGGLLWVLADGRGMRGIYDAQGRLERFVDDTPPGQYLHTLTDVDGQLFGSNEQGIYIYERNRWSLAIAGVQNARIDVARSEPGKLFYVARGEYGWIERHDDAFIAHQTKAPELNDSYNCAIDANGIGWLELGVRKVARFDPHGAAPSIEIFGAEHGLTNGWAEIYVLDGVARFHLTNQVYRFDEDRQYFVSDTTLLEELPALAMANGRPATDAFGRLWFTLNGAAHVVDRQAKGANRSARVIPVALNPTSYTMEDNGVVWMFERRRLARMDLRIPPPAPRPIHALITSLQFSSSGRQIFGPGDKMDPIDFIDNSLVFNFAAPVNPFATPVTFEVLLEGTGMKWTPAGAIGSVSFNRLKEGDYVFRVRPVVGESTIGTEARLAFSIRPPWFRTFWAWAIYVAAALGLIGAIVWFSSFLQRRENERLELLVAERTGKLHASNAKLERQITHTTAQSAALFESEERYRRLNAELETRVEKRSDELKKAHEELMVASRHAGMAEVATGVLHNVGNVLNSVNVSAALVRECLRTTVLSKLQRVADMLRVRTSDMTAFLTTDPKGRLIPAFIIQLSDQLTAEHATMQREHEHLDRNVEHIKGIVAMQQSHARVSGVLEKLQLNELIDDVVQMHELGLKRHHIEIVRNYAKVPLLVADKHKILQILVNLIQNAKRAIRDRGVDHGRMELRIDSPASGRIHVSVTDNGAGISADNLTHIFSHGFTTRRDGHGFGLHSGANAAREMGGSLSATSDGPNQGATFTLELPLTPRESSHE
ncbi:ATP-binding protein [Synoicihabitans lomoniglobus]|uniref:histidine kinase n=1 Tax=Synoicihabitans lomoniglobus TaxID=2909285 RepID=A0AAF0I316_9BACT|nr:ATP-binding protein [Opitutaceae bacterium LMO-M01]WED65864.1 ATP-binding protein [Opitutaceae bacterium LMO-M01]